MQVNERLGADWCVCDKGYFSSGRGCDKCPVLFSTPAPGAKGSGECELEKWAIGLIVGISVGVPLLIIGCCLVRRKLRKLEQLRQLGVRKQIEEALNAVSEISYPMVIDSDRYIAEIGAEIVDPVTMPSECSKWPSNFPYYGTWQVLVSLDDFKKLGRLASHEEVRITCLIRQAGRRRAGI